MGSKTRLGSYCTKRANNGVNLVTSRKINTRLARPIVGLRMRKGWSLAVQPHCLKRRVVCGIVYGDMHQRDLLGSIVRAGYRFPVPDFYLVLHGPRC